MYNLYTLKNYAINFRSTQKDQIHLGRVHPDESPWQHVSSVLCHPVGIATQS